MVLDAIAATKTSVSTC
jgi:hypothetical protein